ncbi:MAG: sensor histidine kinase [Minicystis sp.]
MLVPLGWPILDIFRSPRASVEDEAAFEADCVSRVAVYGCAAALLLNALDLLWWPTDAFLLNPDPTVRAAMGWFRATSFVNHAVFFVLLSRPALRRASVLLFGLAAVISSALLGVAMARSGRLEQPFFYMTYLAPMATVAIPLRLPQRISVCFFMGVAISLAYLVVRPADLRSPFLGTALGCMFFAVATAISYGHLLFLVTRSAFLSERGLARSAEALKGYSEDLEGRVGEHTRQIRRLAAHIDRAAEEERARLSRELHDELGQQISAMRYTLSYVRARFEKDPRGAQERLAELEQILGELAAGVRDLVCDLYPRVLDDRGLGPAVAWLVERARERSGLRCEISLSVDAAVAVRRDVAGAAFRIVQESLTNVARHARATRVCVALEVDHDGVRALVEDDGCGVGPVHAGSGGMGLLGMRERARAHGGRLEIVGRPGAGTAVSVHLPLAPGDTP